MKCEINYFIKTSIFQLFLTSNILSKFDIVSNKNMDYFAFLLVYSDTI